MDKAKSRIYNEMKAELAQKLGNRPYSMGLDLGVGSIGCAVIAMEEDKNGQLYPTDIVYAGSRLFESSAGAAKRRKSRGQRNSIRHKRNRLIKLWKLLSETGIMQPYSSEEVANPATLRFSEAIQKANPYDLRYKGLSEEISLEELGVALYHIASHRGSSSVRSFLDAEESKDEEESNKQRSITSDICKANNVNTFIEVIKIFNADSIVGYRNKKGRATDKIIPIPTRDVIINEVGKLLSKQAQFHPETLTPEYIARIKDCMFYENPKLVPEPGNCPYFPDEKRLPRASFINEERRLWEAINNVRIKQDVLIGGYIREEKISLPKAEKELLFSELRKGTEIKESKFKKLFPQYAKASIILQGTDKKNNKIAGFRFTKLENAPFFSALSEEARERYIALFVNTADDEVLKNKLQNELGLSADDAAEALTIQIVGDYAPVGKTAMKIILKKIVDDGFSFAEAEEKAIEENLLPNPTENLVYDILPYYGEVIPSCTKDLAGKAWHSAFEGKFGTEGFIKPNTAPEEEKYGKIGNPVVHQTLNELRKLVNELIDIFGRKPVSITVELGRELKMGIEKREKLGKELNDKAKQNTRIYKSYCVPFNLSPKYIKRFKFLEEQNGICPYCLQTITAKDVAMGIADLDHIFPEDDTADSSENNLVLAHTACNETVKKKQIPHTAFSSNSQLWSEIEQYLSDNPAMASKRWRFEMTEEEYRQYLDRHTFLSRFKSDNAYVARVACEYLQALFPKDQKYKQCIRTISGAETALLRRAWNLNGITQALGDLHTGKCGDGSYTPDKDRTDARHHALDAIVAGYYTLSAKNLINKMAGKDHTQGEIAKRIPIPMYFRQDSALSTKEQREAFRSSVENFIMYHAFVSRKMNTDKNGELLQATQYSILASSDTSLILFQKKLVKDMKPKSIEGEKSGSIEYAMHGRFAMPSWVSPEDRAVIESYMQHNGEVYRQIKENSIIARKLLEEENQVRKEKGKKPVNITDTTIAKKTISISKGRYYIVTSNQRQKVFVATEPTETAHGSAFDTGRNYCLDLYHDGNGILKGEIIRKINANTIGYIPNYKKQGFVLFERLYNNDVIEMDLLSAADCDKPSAIPRSIFSANAQNGKTYLSIQTFTEVGKGIRIFFDTLFKARSSQACSFYLDSFQATAPRKVCLSSAGLVIYRSRELKNRT